MKKILITGAGGFIGKNLSEKLCNAYEVSAPNIEELNLLNSEMVEAYLKKNRFDVIIHTANYGARDAANAQPNDVMKYGLMMFFNLERCSEYYGKMYYFGSGAEYDRQHYIPFMKEEYFGKYIPMDEYGLYKYILSKYINQKANIIDLRLFGVYGKYEWWATKFLSCNICRALNNMPLTLSQNVYFDYMFIDDLAKIMMWFIENDAKYKHYNVCTGSHIELKTIAEKIIKQTCKELKLLVANEGWKLEYSGDNSRLISEMGGFEFTSIDEGIKELIKYYQENMNNIDKTKLI